MWSGSMEVTVGDCSEILVVLGSGTWEVKKIIAGIDMRGAAARRGSKI